MKAKARDGHATIITCVTPYKRCREGCGNVFISIYAHWEAIHEQIEFCGEHITNFSIAPSGTEVL